MVQMDSILTLKKEGNFSQDGYEGYITSSQDGLEITFTKVLSFPIDKRRLFDDPHRDQEVPPEWKHMSRDDIQDRQRAKEEARQAELRDIEAKRTPNTNDLLLDKCSKIQVQPLLLKQF